MTRAAPLVALLVVFALGCDKAPPELPAQPVNSFAVVPHEAGPPGRTLSSEANPPSVRNADRCVRPLPANPPAPVLRGSDPACPRDPSGGPPMVPAGHVVFPESKDAPTLEVELMLTEERQERGLMYRHRMPEDKGMLFAWSSPSVHTFWMHNTCIPLDMLFIDGDGVIAGIVENAPTLNDEGRSVDCPVRYVLEVNAGWSRRHGVAPGQQVRIDGVRL